MRPAPARLAAAFLILFALYQSAEGIGGKLLGSFPVQAGLMVAAVLAAWPVGRWLGYRGYDAYGLDLKPRSFALLGAMLLLAMGAKCAGLVWGMQAGVYTLAPAAITGIAMAMVATFIPSIAEDILTRGFFLRAANPGWSGWAFVLGSAAIFTLNHIYRFDWGVTEQLRLFAIGLVYALAAWKWRTLWAAVGLHWGYNLANELTGPLADAVDATAVRWVTIGLHLALLAIVLLLPAKRDEAAHA
ncbi:CPBP family intramembrane glutamic endopeptidase [Sphingomonas soli]|uniref:CPBP family intramembrane glutamic endopeptidase n=1 Tax=Sphingomonas soli TaxID=266127 RepID=UPI00082D73E0|nr:CPBP family intramembrane glutamic endopeptidase [Sphingomonas soli]